jgi:hypothetical protein
VAQPFARDIAISELANWVARLALKLLSIPLLLKRWQMKKALKYWKITLTVQRHGDCGTKSAEELLLQTTIHFNEVKEDVVTAQETKLMLMKQYN